MLAAVAYGYFTSNGTGTGAVAVGTASNVELSSDSVSGLLPGAPALPVTVHIHNPGSSGAFVGQINGAVQDNGECLGAWFAVAPVSYGLDLAAGGRDTASTNISMLDPGVNQDVCQGQSLTINWFTGSEPAVSHDAVHLLRFVKVQDGEFDASVGGWVYVFSVTLDRPSAVNMAIPIRLDHLSPSPGLIASIEPAIVLAGQSSTTFAVIVYDKSLAGGAYLTATLNGGFLTTLLVTG